MISVKKNYIWNTAYQVLTILIPLITTPYISRVLGAEGVGVYSYTNSIVSYFVLFAIMGTTIYGQRAIANHQNDIIRRTQCFFEIVIFRFATTLLATSFYLIIALQEGEFKLYYLILIGQLINVCFDITWFFQGMEEFSKIVFRNFIVKICNVISIFVFIKATGDLWLYLVLLIGFSLLGNISMWTMLRKYICRVKNLNPFRHFKGSLLLFLPAIATQVYTILDKTMIGLITGSTYQNGCYEQAENISRIAITLVGSISTVIAPRIAKLHSEGNIDEIKRYVYMGYRFVLLLAVPIVFGIIGVSDLFVPVFFGEGYELAKTLMKIFSALVISVGFATISGIAYLISTHQQNVYTITVAISAVINFILNIVLIPNFGAVGAAIASVIAEIVGASLQIAYCCVKKQLNFTKIFTSFWRYAIAGIIMLVALLAMQLILPINILGLLALIGVGIVIYFTILFILRDDFLLCNTKRALKKILKK